MNEYVALVSHAGKLYALTRDGKIFEISETLDGEVRIILLVILPDAD